MLSCLSILVASSGRRARRRWSDDGFSSVALRNLSTSLPSTSPSSKKNERSPFAPRDDPVKIEKLLISNRGEIACRIIHTARRLGIPTVAVFSDADSSAPHVALANEAVRLGPPQPSLSYLSVERLLSAARATGATAVHPGYGFLSESASFAESVVGAGLTWVGPPPSAMRSMGDKAAAKKLMSEAGVPVVPGYHGEDQSDERLAAEAERVGFPILIKAVLGGGGKGMKVARDSSEVSAAVGAARREAVASFGDGRLLLERLVRRPRHLEVQVVADSHGRALSFAERDCSVQRRHQKVIEEAPGPGLPSSFRGALGSAAVAAAEAVGYEGAGTVEFIVDESSRPCPGSRDSSGRRFPEFFFMEMNTRLQVEHPVTEAAVAGMPDLVELQLRVAAGERLPLPPPPSASDGESKNVFVPLSGHHAVEARLYAERPEAGFLPAAGVLSAWRPPRGALEFRWSTSEAPAETTTRVDAGISGPGDAVGVNYDPMIAKILCMAPDRDRALEGLSKALETMRVGGISTNAGLLWRLSRRGSSFREAGSDSSAVSLDTHFLEEHSEEMLRAPRPTPRVLALAVAALHAAGATAASRSDGGGRRALGGAWASSDGARPGSGLSAWRRFLFEHESSGSVVEATVEQRSEGGGEGGGGGSVGVLRISTTTAAAPEGGGEEARATEERKSPSSSPPPEESTITLRDVRLLPPSNEVGDGVWSVSAQEEDTGVRLSADVAFGGGGGDAVVDVWPSSGEGDASSLGAITEPCVSLRLPVPRHWDPPEDSSSSENRGAAASPMPGRVVRLGAFAVGDAVKKGDVLCLLEAMKMEHPVRSPIDGVLMELDAAVGALVGGGERLALVVAVDEAPGGEERKAKK